MRERLGPNDRQPCGTRSAKITHLAKGEQCDTCGTSPWPTGVDHAQREEEARRG